MEILWRYDLPTDEKSRDYEFEGPILLWKGMAFFHSCDGLHVLDGETGREVCGPVKLPWCSERFVLGFESGVLLWAKRWYLWQDGALRPLTALAGRGAPVCHLRREDCLFLLCQNTLLCLNLQTLTMLWELDISRTGHNYRPGNLEWMGEVLTCFGRDMLLFVDPETGEIIDTIKIPRIDKLFCPQLQSDGQLVMGYTNWTVAGILRYDPVTRKVIWQHRRKFGGPQL